MRKIASQIAGAAALVAAVSAGFAYAQTTDSSSTTSTPTTRTVTPPKSEDLKSNSTDSRYGAGANNGSTYNPAIRSTDIKAGNVSSVEDPAVTTRTTTTPAATSTPSSTSSTTTDGSTYSPAPATATSSTDSGNWNADGTRAARADRN